MPDVIRVYVDGGAKGRISWIIQTFLGEKKNFTTIPELETSNEAEFYAVLRALNDIPNSSIVEIHSDSQLVVNGLSPNPWNITAENLIRIIEKIKEKISERNLYVSFFWTPNNLAGKIIQRIVREEKMKRVQMRKGFKGKGGD